MLFIQSYNALKTLCDTLEKQEFITLDTEFVREKTYYPKLCLIQVGWRDDAAIIDPLNTEMDLSPFVDILNNKKILKVFHSARQDIEIFYNISGKVPYPLFDTQIAASVLGFGYAVSYDNMVEAITGVKLDKSTRLTDWSIRPLDEKQLQYALRDVTFLFNCYEYLVKKLKEKNRITWIKEETDDLLDEKHYKPDPDTAWQKIRHSAHNEKFLSVLKELAAWRELKAIQYNVPKKNIIKDELLVAICASMPQTTEELKQVRNIRADIISGKLGEEIISVLEFAKNKPIEKNLRKIDKEKKVNIPCGAAALTEVLKLLLKIKCEQEGVVQSIVATEQNIRDLACGNDQENPILKGWRYDLFGKDALAFRKGLVNLSYDTIHKKIVITKKEKKEG